MTRPFIVEYRIKDYGGPGVWSRWFFHGRFRTNQAAHDAVWRAQRIDRAFWMRDPNDREYRIEERPVKP